MNTFATMLDAAALRLQSHSDSARLDAELLLVHVLGCSRSHLRAHGDLPVSDDAAHSFEALLARRQRGEPIAYITGKREFWSMELKVTSDTLIPRPETELLVEVALMQIPPGATVELLDLGTGSGAVALALARERPHSRVIATDASATALAVAAENAQRLAIRNVRFLQADWFEFETSTRFDVVVSNPPYVAPEDPHLAEGDLRFEPAAALVARDGGLADLKRIVSAAPPRLHSGGSLYLEHGAGQGSAVRDLLEQRGYRDVHSHRDLAGHERVTAGVWVNKPD